MEYDEEKIFLENEKLIHYVLQNKISKIPGCEYEDLYQMGSIALLKAIRTYDESLSKFSTYAVKVIYNNVASYAKGMNRRSKIIDIDHLDDIMYKNNEGDVITVSDILEDKANIPNDLKIIIDESLNSISERDRGIVELYLQGYTNLEIKDIFNISQPHVSRIVNKFRKLVNEDFKTNYSI